MKFEHVVDIHVTVGDPVEVGITPAGRRRIIPITGGTFEGPRLKGKVTGGADWQVIDANLQTRLEARYTLQTDNGAIIYVVNNGVRRGPKQVMQRLIRGEDVPPDEYYFRTAPLFEVADGEQYGWLNDYLFVAECERHPTTVDVKVFQVL